MVTKKSKLIFIYGIMHTGNVFTRKLLSSVYSGARVTRNKKPQYYHIKELLNVPESKELTKILFPRRLRKTFIHYGPKNNRKKTIILAIHHGTTENIIAQYLSNNKPPIPFICTLRDPLLIANTFYWRWIAESKNPSKDKRRYHIKRQVACLLQMLTNFKNNVFIFPIDLDIKSKGKAIELLKYCRLPISPNIKRTIANWSPVNKTKETQASKHRKIHHQTTKQAIKNKDIITINSLLGVEFRYLQKQTKLKQELYNIGYRDLAWW